MAILIFLTVLNTEIQQQKTCEISNCVTKTALTYLCNVAGTDYQLPVDDTSVETCSSTTINYQLIVHLLIHCTK
jgi:hypothetical protein